MTTGMPRAYLHVIGDLPVRLWGLTPRERLLRQIRQVAGVSPIEDLETLPPDATLLLVHGGLGLVTPFPARGRGVGENRTRFNNCSGIPVGYVQFPAGPRTEPELTRRNE